MHRKDGVLWSSIFLVFILVLGGFGLSIDYESDHQQSSVLVSEPDWGRVSLAGTPHAPITIDGDDNFSATAVAEGWSGDGSSETPYLITGLDIALGGVMGHCISIVNTRVNFTISNCNLTGASVNPGAGIYMNNVTNGKIINNSFLDDYYGIYFYECDNNTITDNVLDTNTWGIHLNYAESNLIDNNTCTNHWRGIVIYRSTLNMVVNNICNYNAASGIAINEANSNVVSNNICNHQSYNGIDLIIASSNIVRNNTCESNAAHGIFLQNSQFNTVSNNIVSSNSDNGISVSSSHSNTLSRNTCGSNGFYGILLENSDSNTISHSNCSNNGYHGIILDDAESNTVSNSICINNYYYGIYISSFDSDSNTVSNNTCSNNGSDGICIEYSLPGMITNNTCNNNGYNGILVINSDSNNISNNTCNNNDMSGIYISDGDSNIISHNKISGNYYGMLLSPAHHNDARWNVFIDNQENANSYSSNNIFDYNYWSDYDGIDGNQDGIGDSSYSISGGSIDSHPLMYLPYTPRWTSSIPESLTVEYPYSFWFDFDATAPSPIFWSVNDTIRFAIDEDGFLESFGGLPVGNHGLNVTVANIYEFSLSAIFRISVVRDASNPPGWWTIPTNQVLTYLTEFEYQVIAIDPSGIDRWELNDTTHFSLQASFYADGSTACITNKTILQPGSYALDLTVYDIYGNELSAVVTVTVEPPTSDTTPPEWIIGPLDQTIAHGSSLVIQLAAWDESGIDHWVIDDITHFSIDEYGVIRNNTVLVAGEYPLTVDVYDVSGNGLSGNLTITVNPPQEDTTPPAWVTFHITQTIEYGESLEVFIEAWDSSGIDNWWLNDTNHFTLDEHGLLQNVVILEPGVYRLEVRAYDPYGNYCSAILVVTVLEAPTTTTPTTTSTTTVIITTTITTTTSTSSISTTTPTTPSLPSGIDPLVTLVIGAGLGGGLVVIIVIIMVYRKEALSRLGRRGTT